MIVSEDFAKQLLSRYGLRTPRGRVATTVDEAGEIAAEFGGAGVVKALIPIGGRGKAGGVRVCSSVGQVREAASMLLGKDLLGHRVERLLVEEEIEVAREVYAGVVANSATDKIDLIVSFTGGVDIENTAQNNGDAVRHLVIEPGDILPTHRVRGWLRSVEANGVEMGPVADVLVQLYRAAADLDAILLEINPLAVGRDGSLVLLDCKLEVDDNGLVRQPELAKLYRDSLGDRELRAKELGVSYVPLDGDIAVITSGAGLGMATLDLLKQQGMEAANFLDTGGGISERLVKGALELIMEPPQVRGAIINLYGGINRMLEAAKGIVAALGQIDGDRPVVVKVLGNQQEEAWALLESQPNVRVVRVVQTETAVAELAGILS